MLKSVRFLMSSKRLFLWFLQMYPSSPEEYNDSSNRYHASPNPMFPKDSYYMPGELRGLPRGLFYFIFCWKNLSICSFECGGLVSFFPFLPILVTFMKRLNKWNKSTNPFWSVFIWKWTNVQNNNFKVAFET